MDIFNTKTFVSGAVVRGSLEGKKFVLSDLNTTGGIQPMIKERVFDKAKLETTIKEFQEVLTKLK